MTIAQVSKKRDGKKRIEIYIEGDGVGEKIRIWIYEAAPA